MTSLTRLLLLVTFLIPTIVVAQVYAPQPGQYGVDDELGFLLIQHSTRASAPFERVELEGRTFDLATPTQAVHYDKPYPATCNGQPFNVHFTRLPLVTLRTDQDIPDEPKIPVQVTYADGARIEQLTGGVELRGVYALNFPKKTLDLEFDRDGSFGGLREDDDWILDAVYNEPLRVNAYIAHKLWLEQHQLYYHQQDERAKAGADVQFVEAFLNGRYYGVHMLSEQVDRKQLRLKKNRDGNLRGELYKGSNHLPGTDFAPDPPLPDDSSEEWSGFEYKYPKPVEEFGWGNLYEHHQWATQSSDEQFIAEASERLNLENIIDNLLFVNFLGLIDNSHRNTYVARYDAGEPYINIPWDFDGSFGNSPRGLSLPRHGFWHVNGLTRRLIQLDPNGFNEQLCQRYQELRQEGLYSEAGIRERFDAAMAHLKANNVYAREEMAWPELLDYSEKQRSYTFDWVQERLRFLDDLICDLKRKPEGELWEGRFTVYPNPVRGVAIVEQFEGFVEPFYAVYDAWGTRLQSGWCSARFPIDMSPYPPGAYYVRVGRQLQVLLVK